MDKTDVTHEFSESSVFPGYRYVLGYVIVGPLYGRVAAVFGFVACDIRVIKVLLP